MEREDGDGWLTRRDDRDRFITRVAIAGVAFGFLFLFWHVRHAVILIFAGVVVAVVLLALADPLRRRTGLAHGTSLLLSALTILSILSVFVWIAAPQVRAQGIELLRQLPDSFNELDRLVGGWLPEDILTNDMLGTVAGRLAQISGMMLGALTSVVLVIAAGIFLAIKPGAYRDGVVLLFAPARQSSIRQALDRAGDSLKGWLRGKLLSMLVIGIAVGLATWALGLPSPFALGLIAALFAFVPIIGPIAASIPALLLALTMGPSMVLWTALTYFAIEQFESNLVLPFAQQETSELPPVLLIFSFVAVGSIFGFAGIVVAAPLTVAIYSLVCDLYIRPINEGAAEATRSVPS